MSCLPTEEKIHKMLWVCALVQSAQERYTGSAQLEICNFPKFKDLEVLGTG